MFSVVFWPVVILHNRFFKAKLDRTRHAGSHFLTEYWPRPMVSCSDSNCSYFSLIENHLIIWVLGWFFTLEVGLPVVDRMTVAAELECSLQFIFVSLACVANDVFDVLLDFLVKACLRGSGGPQVGKITSFNPLWWGNPPVHIIYHFNLITFTWGGGGGGGALMKAYMDRQVTSLNRVTSPTWGPTPLRKQALRVRAAGIMNTSPFPFVCRRLYILFYEPKM